MLELMKIWLAYEFREHIRQIFLLQLFKLLQSVPLINIARVSQAIQISIPTINAAFDRLQEPGIVREITDRQRDKLYSYENYINLLSEGTEPI